MQAVRPQVVTRDGHCRLLRAVWTGTGVFPPCSGPSEWSHLEGKKRARTRGQAPEDRHTTAGSAMMCERHHGLYDDGPLRLEMLTPVGADGPLRWTYGALVCEEQR